MGKNPLNEGNSLSQKNIFVDIAYTFCNNLLEKINYKLIKKKNEFDNKTKFILKYNNL